MIATASHFMKLLMGLVYVYVMSYIYIYMMCVCIIDTLYINENPSGSEGGNAIKDQDRLISLRLCKLVHGI